MSFRKEKKYRLSSYEASVLKVRLISSGMKRLYHDRKIVSIYFDTYDYKSFYDSEEGSLPRKKIRVRYYPSEISIMNLEIKMTSIEGRYKKTSTISGEDYFKLIKFGFVDNLYGKCIPTAQVTYSRSYYQILNGVRVTFDKDIIYKNYLNKINFREFEEVMEIKMPYETPDSVIKKWLSIPESRFSKYARSINSFKKNN